jgi:uncharacterized protein (DUF2236 family)
MADQGYFPRGRSVLRRVHGERAVGVVYGQRALLMQATDPLAFAGLTANTTGLEAPFRRLARTAKTMETVFFGTRAQADRETARVRKLHATVKGAIEEPAGPHPAGSTYRADDPAFLLWILACLADSAQATYERLVRPLSSDERDSYWEDYLVLGELFGLPRTDAPATYDEYRAYIAQRLASPDLHLVPAARDLGRRVAFDLPLPINRRPALPVINFMVIGLLPPRVRRLFGLSWSPVHEATLTGLAVWLRVARPLAPARLRRGASAREYEVVARTEARRLGSAA